MKKLTKALSVLMVLFFSHQLEAGLERLAPVRIEYYFVPDCEACRTINGQVLPRLEAQCTGRYEIVEYDLNDEESYLRLAARQERTGRLVNEPVFMAVGDAVLLAGLQAIRTGLVDAVTSARAVDVEVRPSQSEGRGLLLRRVEAFRPLALLGAGLIDGLNPCAIASLVFLMGLLVSSRVKGPLLAGAGFFFCLSSFLAYYLIGLGLLATLKALSAHARLRLWINGGMATALCVMAFLSFRDAFRFARNGAPDAMSLKLPSFLRDTIRRIGRKGIRAYPIFLAAFVLGFVVTVIESVCTGQLYAPTLAWVAKTTPDRGRALGLLAVYNVGFILPLAGVFAAMSGGASIFSLLGWHTRHVSKSKIALGLLFLALAAALALNN